MIPATLAEDPKSNWTFSASFFPLRRRDFLDPRFPDLLSEGSTREVPSVAHRESRLSHRVKRVKKKSTSVATSNTGVIQNEKLCDGSAHRETAARFDDHIWRRNLRTPSGRQALLVTHRMQVGKTRALRRAHQVIFSNQARSDLREGFCFFA